VELDVVRGGSGPLLWMVLRLRMMLLAFNIGLYAYWQVLIYKLLIDYAHLSYSASIQMVSNSNKTNDFANAIFKFGVLYVTLRGQRTNECLSNVVLFC
jgi:hypothetical protein